MKSRISIFFLWITVSFSANVLLYAHCCVLLFTTTVISLLSLKGRALYWIVRSLFGMLGIVSVIVCDIFLQLCYRRFFSCHAKFTPKGMRISSFHFKARNCTRQLSFSFLCNCCWIFFLLVHSWFCYSLVSSVQPNCVSGNNVSRIIHYCVSDLHVADCHVFCLQCFDAVSWVAGRASGL